MSELLSELFERVATFQVDRWNYQELQLYNPYALASIGYSVVSQNQLQCHLCHHSVTFPSKIMQNDEFYSLLYDHREHCQYREVKMKAITAQQVYLHLDQLYENIIKGEKANSYPVINVDSMMKYIGRDCFIFRKVISLYSQDVLKIPFLLNLFGWKINQKSLSCFFCGRSIQLSAFESQLSDNHSSEKQMETETTKLLDLTAEHRYFCVWVGEEKGWLVYLQHLLDKESEFRGYKTKKGLPLSETKKMRVEIDKFIEKWGQKMEASFGLCKESLAVCEETLHRLGDDNNLNGDEVVSEGKRLREVSGEIDEFRQGLRQCLKNPLKKIKLS